ncbi:hypothetical protein [Puniceibacterium sp. IMCC21224]|uniref:helix-turn-helix domain-containing protein n=1 Tax=Puniceibacterium sp. IMCC21224 TaxID=1618204 RepID=UPI00064DE364|nr:hypothetical protein [Puniceibacterium sp. IMCC21224]KMK66437.1 hypothetical protein IMCC21224_111288 [Puniceibacterium sp. IMCC21224]
MLSKFGKLARDHRDQLGLTVDEFARLMRMGVEDIEACENQRALCDEDLVSQYSQVLGISKGSQPHLNLSDAANEANQRYTYHRKFLGDDRLMALLARHGDALSDAAKAKINRIVADDIARLASIPKYQPKDAVANVDDAAGKIAPEPLQPRAPLPSLSPARFASLVLLSEDIRQLYIQNEEPLSAVAFLKAEAERSEDLTFEVCANMPLFAPDSDVVIAGGSRGHTIFAQESFVAGCVATPRSLGNHVLLHEYAHHRLHAEDIRNAEAGYLPPHRLAHPGGAIPQDTELDAAFALTSLTELEADFLATLLTIPWIKLAEVAIEGYKLRFMTRKLARDFGAPEQVAERLVRYLRIDVARDRIREGLYRQNRIDHPFLLLL